MFKHKSFTDPHTLKLPEFYHQKDSKAKAIAPTQIQTEINKVKPIKKRTGTMNIEGILKLTHIQTLTDRFSFQRVHPLT